MVKKRTPIPQNIQDELIFANDKTCCICNKNKKVIIHHINENPSDNNIDNLLIVCSNCHEEIHTKTSMSKQFSEGVLKKYKKEWEENVKKKRNGNSQDLSVKQTIPMVKEEFINILNTIEFGGHTLNSLFVWPEFYYTSTNEEKNIDSSINLFLEEKNKNCFVKGVNLSGKSSIGKKIYLDLLPLNYYPLLINGGVITKGNLNFDNVLKKEFHDQYNGKYEEYTSLDKKIIIVDNYHVGIHPKFIDFCNKNFLKIIFLVSEDDFVMYFKDEENYVSFNTYTIQPFNNTRKHDLIFNWLKKDYQDADEVYNHNFDLLENRIEDITNKNNIFPKFPFYLLSIIQAFENSNTRDLNMSSYGHCYYALILAQLDKKIISKTERTSCLNFLKNLAFHIYNLNKSLIDEITQEEYVRFKIDYSGKYNFMSKSSLNKLEDDQYPIFRIKNGKLKFEFEYFYYYFIGKYIAEIEENKELVENLMNSIYKKSSSNILIFTIHHTSSSKLLDEIQLHCITTFDSCKLTLLTNEDTIFLNSLIKELPQSFLTNKTISENRKDEQHFKDKSEKNYKELTDSEIEENKEIIELSKAFKIIEVLGQILKNRSGNLEKVKLEELLLDIENLGLRLMTYLLETIKSEHFFNTIEKMIEHYEELKGKKNINNNDKRKKIEEFIQNMGLRTIIGLLFKIFQSVNIVQLNELQRNISKKNPYPSYELLFTLFNLNYGKFKYDEVKDLYNKFKEDKNIFGIKALSFFTQIYMNNHYIEQNIRQSLHDLFGIKKYIPNKVSK